jgi:hypothetical protein
MNGNGGTPMNDTTNEGTVREAERRGAAEIIRHLREMAPYSADPVLIWTVANVLEMTPLDHEVRPTQAIWDEDAGVPVPIVPRIVVRPPIGMGRPVPGKLKTGSEHRPPRPEATP